MWLVICVDGDTIKLQENPVLLHKHLKTSQLTLNIMSAKEIWKPVHPLKYSKNYQISNLGRVRNTKTKYVLKSNSKRSGYNSVWFSVKGEGIAYKIHQLVAHAFIPKPKNAKKNLVNHIDGDKLNNVLTNLEWVTAKENVDHGFKTGLTKSLQRKVDQYDKNGKFIKTFNSLKEAKEETGIDDGTIVKVCKGRRNHAGGYIWKYHVIHDREKPDLNPPKRKKDLEDYPDYYVTDDGRVFSKRYKKYMKPHKNADGYLHIQVTKNKVKKDYLIHRLVATAFLDNSDDKPTVNHKNKLKTDNRVENLEWSTYSENARHNIKVDQLKKEIKEAIKVRKTKSTK